MRKYFLAIVLVLGMILPVSAKTTNFAREKGVSYDVATGSYYADRSKDKYNTLLNDGVLNSGNQVAVCYDFFRQPDEEKYVIVTFDLKKKKQLEKIVLHGLNHTELYNVVRCLFEVSSDGLDYEVVADIKGDKIPKGGGTWKVSTELNETARFVRVTAWTTHWLNLEEVEIFGQE